MGSAQHVEDLNYLSDIKTINDQLVEIPGGDIVMRDNRINRKWNVDIHPFLLAMYPVTQQLYNDLAKETPSFFKGDKKPVECVTWIDAVRFCNLLYVKAGLISC